MKNIWVLMEILLKTLKLKIALLNVLLILNLANFTSIFGLINVYLLCLFGDFFKIPKEIENHLCYKIKKKKKTCYDFQVEHC